MASRACNRCKYRKKKCDGNFAKGTVCSRCKEANADCLYSSQLKPSYIKMLENKVDVLEARIQELQLKCADCQSCSGQELTHTSACGKKNIPNLNKSLTHYAASIPVIKDHSSPYVGSSGVSVASLVENYLNKDVEVKSSSTIEVSFGISIGSKEFYSSVEYIIQDETMVSIYMDNFFSMIHIRYPFLQKDNILSLHRNRREIFSVLNSNISSDMFILLMVYAIGAFVKHEGKINNDLTPNHWYLYAFATSGDFKNILQDGQINSIHAILLLVIYRLRRPSGLSIWYLIGIAMRICIDCGLHRRDIEEFESDPNYYVSKSKTFWSTYSLERIISHTFGRPFSIDDRDIDIDLPIDLDESDKDVYLIKNKFYQTYPHLNLLNFEILPKVETNRTSMTIAILFFKLRLIDSMIQKKVYRVTKSFDEPPRKTISEIQERMRQWVQSLPNHLTIFEYDYCLYLFNKQIRSLLVPFINKLEADDPLFIECIKSSINICKMSTRIHDSDKVRNRLSIISLQTIFLSGMTIIYGILSEKTIWDSETSGGLRACSQTLQLLSGRDRGSVEYNEAFDKLLTEVKKKTTISSPATALASDLLLKVAPVDAFGQKDLIDKVNEKHYEENMNTFNELTKAQYLEQENNIDSVFNFNNVNQMFTPLDYFLDQFNFDT